MRLVSMGNEFQNLVNMLLSGGLREVVILFKNMFIDFKYFLNKIVGNDGDKVKNFKGLVLLIQDKKLLDVNENIGSYFDK